MLERFLLILENCITIIDFWIIKNLCVKARFTISWGHAFKVRPSHSPMSLQERTHRVFRPLQVLRQRFKLRDYDEEEPGHSDETQSSPWGRHTKQKSLSLFFHNTRRTVCSYPPISAVREVFLSAQISRGAEGGGGRACLEASCGAAVTRGYRNTASQSRASCFLTASHLSLYREAERVKKTNEIKLSHPTQVMWAHMTCMRVVFWNVIFN